MKVTNGKEEVVLKHAVLIHSEAGTRLHHLRYTDPRNAVDKAAELLKQEGVQRVKVIIILNEYEAD